MRVRIATSSGLMPMEGGGVDLNCRNHLSNHVDEDITEVADKLSKKNR
jgi:hypothetical protein